MNERIRELAASVVPVHEQHDGKPVYQYWEDFDKFAELIVRECGQFTIDIINAGDVPAEHANALLLAHFGIKE